MPLKHCFDLVRVCTNSTIPNDETKILSFCLCKRALLEAKLQGIRLKQLKHRPHMDKMFLRRPRVYAYVIKVHDDKLMKYWGQVMIHQSLEGRRSVR